MKKPSLPTDQPKYNRKRSSTIDTTELKKSNAEIENGVSRKSLIIGIALIFISNITYLGNYFFLYLFLVNMDLCIVQRKYKQNKTHNITYILAWERQAQKSLGWQSTKVGFYDDYYQILIRQPLD